MIRFGEKRTQARTPKMLERASGNKHATDKIAAELCIHAFYLAMNVACGVACSFPGAK